MMNGRGIPNEKDLKNLKQLKKLCDENEIKFKSVSSMMHGRGIPNATKISQIKSIVKEYNLSDRISKTLALLMFKKEKKEIDIKEFVEKLQLVPKEIVIKINMIEIYDTLSYELLKELVNTYYEYKAKIEKYIRSQTGAQLSKHVMNTLWKHCIAYYITGSKDKLDSDLQEVLEKYNEFWELLYQLHVQNYLENVETSKKYSSRDISELLRLNLAQTMLLFAMQYTNTKGVNGYIKRGQKSSTKAISFDETLGDDGRQMHEVIGDEGAEEQRENQELRMSLESITQNLELDSETVKLIKEFLANDISSAGIEKLGKKLKGNPEVMAALFGDG